MKKIILSSLFLLLICLSAEAQNYIYKGDKQYISTNTWEFGTYPTKLDVTIAKHANGAYLMLSRYVTFKHEYIGGTVIVFLSDGSMIKCTDKGIRDHVDGNSVALYNFTKSEVEKLKQYRIVRIRYSVINPGFGAENYTVDNKLSLLSYAFIGENNGAERKGYVETDLEVAQLFNN